MRVMDRGKKAPRVTIHRNGDAFNNGIVITLPTKKAGGYQELLRVCTRRFNFRFKPASAIFTIDGEAITDLEILDDGVEIVISDGAAFKRGKERAKPVKKEEEDIKAAHEANTHAMLEGRPSSILDAPLKRKCVNIVRNGAPAKDEGVRVVVSTDNIDDFVEVCSQKLQFRVTPARRLYTSEGILITTCRDLVVDQVSEDHSWIS
jgi:hypothetical protein